MAQKTTGKLKLNEFALSAERSSDTVPWVM